MTHHKYMIPLMLLSLGAVGNLSAQEKKQEAKSDTTRIARSYQLKQVNVTEKKRERKKKAKQEIGKEEITQEQISKQLMLQTKDFIRYMPGVGLAENISRYGNKGFAIRGVDENRVAITVDGLPQAETETNVAFSSYGLINSARPQFESEFIKKIDIRKGASSFEYGTGALGGAVNFESKEASSLIDDGKFYGIQAKVGMDNMQKGRIYSIGGAARYAGFEGLALFASRRGETVRNFSYGPLRRSIFTTQVDPTEFTQQSFLGKLGYTYRDHKLSVSYYAQSKITNTEVWSMEPAYVLTSEQEPYYYGRDQVLTKRWDASYKYTPLDNSWLNQISIFVNSQTSYLDADTHTSIYRPEINNFTPNYVFAGTRRLLKGMSFRDDVYALRANSKMLDFGKWAGMHLITFNASFLRHHTSDKNVDISQPINTYPGGLRYRGQTYPFGAQLPANPYLYSFQRPANRNNFSLSLADKILFLDGKLRVDVGLRFDHFHSYTEDWTEDNDFNYLNYLLSNLKTAGMDFEKSSIHENGLTPMAIVNYEFSPYLSLGYKFSMGYRVPTSQERFFQYVSLSPAFFVLANPQLKRESSVNHELHLGTNKSKYVGYDLSVYYNTYKNYIEPLYGVQKVYIDGQNRDVAYSINENKKNANLWGIDFSAEAYFEEIFPALKPYGSLMLSGSLNYSEGKFSDGTSMMAVQPLKGVLALDYDLPKDRAGISLKLNFLKAKDASQTKFVESFYGDEQISQFPYNFFQNNLTVDLYAYVNINKHLTLRGAIMNLTNQRYWLWDDIRQLISPVMLIQHKDFFRMGAGSMARFSQPQRYISLSLEAKL